MGLEMVLNDLSLLPLAEDIWTARQRMRGLIETLVTAVSLKASRVLRTEYNLHMVEIASGYPIARWLNDSEVDREARRYFRSLATKAPYLQDITDSRVHDNLTLSDFFHNERRSVGLGVAFSLDFLAISFSSGSIWELSSLQLRLEQIHENEVITDLVMVRHASCQSHVHEHSDWIKQRTQVDIQSGQELYASLHEFYPCLQFCLSATAQVQGLPHGEIHLRQIMKHLLDLNSYSQNWLGGPFSAQEIAGKITGESNATLTTYTKEHTFLCPDGIARLFSWHCRITPEPWRIYFYPLEEEKSIIIGYIGQHLPTVKFPI